MVAHHADPVANNPDVAYDENNLVTLCHDCHVRLHARNAEVIGMSVLDMHRVAMTRKPVQCHAFRAVCVGPSRASHPKSRYPEPLGMPLQPNWLGGGSSLTAARCFRFIE